MNRPLRWSVQLVVWLVEGVEKMLKAFVDLSLC